jgi:hypothetical protein
MINHTGVTVGDLLKQLKNYPKDSLIVTGNWYGSHSARLVRSVEPLDLVDKDGTLRAAENDTPAGNAVYFVEGETICTESE